MNETLEESCPVVETIELLGGRYKLLILRALLYAGTPLRFGALKRETPNVSQKTLTRNLRELEQTGLLKRTAYAEVPPRVEYELTPAAQELMPVFLTMKAWRESHRSLRLG
jgi:DNA-binding HxlR family transcriptional regulator